MIELRKISAGYRGEPVLRDVDLVFPAGCVTVLLGPNGCGKSTLLKSLNRMNDLVPGCTGNRSSRSDCAEIHRAVKKRSGCTL